MDLRRDEHLPLSLSLSTAFSLFPSLPFPPLFLHCFRSYLPSSVYLSVLSLSASLPLLSLTHSLSLSLYPSHYLTLFPSFFPLPSYIKSVRISLPLSVYLYGLLCLVSPFFLLLPPSLPSSLAFSPRYRAEERVGIGNEWKCAESCIAGRGKTAPPPLEDEGEGSEERT